MDVLRLNNSTYLPDSIVEDYSSMIWTERYFENGDFEMKTGNVEVVRKLLPEGQLISLLDSDEVMFVENHAIGVDDDGIPELTLTGRTFDTFLENRIIYDVTQKPYTTIKPYTTAQAVCLLVWLGIANATGEDPTKVDTLADVKLAVPNVTVTDSTTVSDAATNWSLESGSIFTKVRDFLKLADLGVRNVRPPGKTANVVNFNTSRTAARGDVSKTSSLVSGLRVDVYNGLNRTRQQTARDSVIFHYASGHIDKPKYLFSIKEYRNIVQSVSSAFGLLDVSSANQDPLVTGLNRRIQYVDAGSQGEQSLAEYQNSVIQKMRIELQKHTKKAIFDGAISPDSPYEYNKHYTLGDIVTLMAEYGIEAPMMVSEYVRTEDKSGDRGYPTLVSAT